MPFNPLILVVAVAVIFLAFRFIPGLQVRGALTLLLIAVIGLFMVATVAEMPSFGEADSPAFNEVPERYLEQGVEDTGAVNITSSIIMDYRAFDTLGEATVLFVAIAAVIATLKAH